MKEKKKAYVGHGMEQRSYKDLVLKPFGKPALAVTYSWRVTNRLVGIPIVHRVPGRDKGQSS